MQSLRSSATLRISHESNTLIKRIQKSRNAFWNVFFRAVSLFGEEKAFAFGFPLLFWHYDDWDAILVCVAAWAVAFYLGHFLKDLLQLPRPFTVCEDIRPMESHLSLEYGFPSTHSLAGFCIPLTLLLVSPPTHSKWMFIFGYLVLAGSIAFSRLYLGVHSLLDVLGGSTLGVCVALMCSAFAGAILRGFRSAFGPVAIMLGCVASLYVYPDTPVPSPAFRDTASILGAASGVVIGDWLLANHVRLGAPSPALSLAAALGKTVIGLLVVAVLHELSCWVTWRLVAGSRSSDSSAKLDHSLRIPYKFLGYIPIGVHALVTAPMVFQYFGF